MNFSRLISSVVLCILLIPTATLANQGESLPAFSKDLDGQIFTISGSNTVGANLAPSWAKRYLQAKGLSAVSIKNTDVENEYVVEGNNGNKRVSIYIKAHGSSTGFKSLLSQDADIAMASRKIKENENQALDPEALRMTEFESEHVVAIDGLAIIVHPDNPINELNVEQVAKIFSGQVSNWSEIGGYNHDINLYARDGKSGTWDTFKNLVLRKQVTLQPGTPRFESNDQLSDTVSKDHGAIGFVGLASVRSAKALGISEESTHPLQPEALFVATEDYPLSRRLFMYTKPNEMNMYVTEFLSFAQSGSGQDVVEQVGFVSQRPMSIASLDGEKVEGPEPYINLIQNGERLSINFRFKSGSSTLDNKAKRDVARLVQYIQSPENAHKTIQLIGFGDLKKSDQRSKVLSKLRALSVKFELQRYGVSTEPVAGFGSYLPVASNDGNSRTKNQRVEVWVFDEEYKRSIRQRDEKQSRAKENKKLSELVSSF